MERMKQMERIKIMKSVFIRSICFIRVPIKYTYFKNLLKLSLVTS